MSLRTLRSLWGWSSIAHHLRYLFGVYPLVILQNQRWHHEESHHDKYSMRCQSHRTIFFLGFQDNKKEKKGFWLIYFYAMVSRSVYKITALTSEMSSWMNWFHKYTRPCIILKIVFHANNKTIKSPQSGARAGSEEGRLLSQVTQGGWKFSKLKNGSRTRSNTRECFIRISKHRKESWKYNTQWSMFDEIRGVWIGDETLSRVFDISSQWEEKLRCKRRRKIVKIYAT